MPDWKLPFVSRVEPDLRKEFVALPQYLLRWVPIALLVGLMAGTASALLIWLLDVATRLRETHLWLIALLPLAGVAELLLYRYGGPRVEGGNKLLFTQIEQPTERVQFRMTPLILLTTFVTHLFGGSAGREGTALQTGGSLADQLARPFRMRPEERRILLMAGVSAGFGSVFGTPLAGAVFGMEVLAIGSVNYDAILPCFVASFVGYLTTQAWRVPHDAVLLGTIPALTARTFVLSCVAGAIFGATALAFSWLAHWIEGRFCRWFAWPAMRPFVGGAVVALGVLALRNTRYVGLGVPVIRASFAGYVHPWDWLGKLLFTAVTLGTGFKGGEVTPLFFVGSTLGNALSHVLPLPTPLLAAMGFVGVFAGAANTPIASMLVAVELFGADAGVFAAIACVVSYLFSGHSGIYRTQRVLVRKFGREQDGTTVVQTNPEPEAKLDSGVQL